MEVNSGANPALAPAWPTTSQPGRFSWMVSSPTWLRAAVAATVLGLALLSTATALVEHALAPMPASHLIVLPIVLAGFCVLWLLDLVGYGPSPVVFSATVVGLHSVLAVAGHTGVHTLFLLLLVAWITYTGTRRDSEIALGLAMAGLGFAAGIAIVAGTPWVTATAAWAAGILAIWMMARALVGQQRLVRELRLAQDELAEQARQTAALEERQRLARELHDSATQSMYGARMFAEAAARLLDAGQTAAAAEQVREVQHLAADALGELRLLIYELRPPVLESEGLAAALRARLDAVESRAGVATELMVEAPDGDRLPAVMESELYGIAREALNNALRHAHAHRITVRLTQTPARVVLAIEDDGAGFAPDREGGAGGQGLRGMRERAARLGTTLQMTSAPDQGTTVRVEVAR